MKKSLFKRIIGFGLACIAAISMAACGGNGNKDGSKKEDPTKTTLNVFTVPDMATSGLPVLQTLLKKRLQTFRLKTEKRGFLLITRPI